MHILRKSRSFRYLCLVLVVCLASTVLVGCGGGGGNGSNDPPAEPVRAASGTVEQSQISGENLQVVSVHDGSTELSSQGQFQTQVAAGNAQLLIAQDEQGEIRGLGFSLPGGQITTAQSSSIAINAHTTTLALLMLSPGLATSNVDQAVQRIRELEAVPQFNALERVMQQNLSSHSLASIVRNNLGGVRELAESCVTDWFLARPQVGTNSVVADAGKARFSLNVPSSEPRDLSRAAVDLCNGGWRHVEVWRQRINSGQQVSEPEAVATGMSAMKGGTALSWGGLLMSTAGEPTIQRELLDLRPQSNSGFRYWVRGVGWGPNADTPPDSIAGESETAAMGCTAIMYGVMPVISLLVGLKMGTKETADKVSLLWQGVKGGIDQTEMVSAFESPARMWAFGIDLFVSIAGVLVVGGSTCILVSALIVSPAVGAILAAVIGGASMIMSAANLSIAVLQWKTLPHWVEVSVMQVPSYTPITQPHDLGVYATATGSWDEDGHVADVTVTNFSDSPITAAVTPGMSFANENPEHQDLTVIDTQWVYLAPYDSATVAVRGACIHRHKGSPVAGEVLTPYRDQRPDLAAVCTTGESLGYDQGTLQEAIWVITDSMTPSDVDRVRRLFVAAGLDPSIYSALAGGSAYSASARHAPSRNVNAQGKPLVGADPSVRRYASPRK